MERQLTSLRWKVGSAHRVSGVRGKLGFRHISSIMVNPSGSRSQAPQKLAKEISKLFCSGAQRVCKPTEIAVLMSHIRCIRRAYADGHEMALVAEDDVDLSLFDENVLRRIVNQELPENWGSLQLYTTN